MPELPDLEVIRGNVFAKLTSKRVTGVEVHDLRKVYASQVMLTKDLVGAELLAIDRVGKELFFDFGAHRILSAHLMLSGEISIAQDEAAVAATSYKLISIRFERETLVISDRGGLCTIKYKPIVSKVPDAFDPAFTLKYLKGAVREHAQMNVKAFLIDQHIIKGIGNAYADEILWAARISPHSLVGKIPEDRLAALHEAIGAVLRDAIDAIRRIAPDIISGEERGFLLVHNRRLKETETGYPILVEKIAMKTTYYTKEQVLYR